MSCAYLANVLLVCAEFEAASGLLRRCHGYCCRACCVKRLVQGATLLTATVEQKHEVSEIFIVKKWILFRFEIVVFVSFETACIDDLYS